MFVVLFMQHGGLGCEQRVYGPYSDYLDAEDALTDGRVPLLYGQGGRAWPELAMDPRPSGGHRYICECTPDGED